MKIAGEARKIIKGSVHIMPVLPEMSYRLTTLDSLIFQNFTMVASVEACVCEKMPVGTDTLTASNL